MPAAITNSESGASVRSKINESFTDLAGKANTSHTHAISDVTGLQTAIDGKQATLVSGTNIKTVNGTSLLGSGDLVVAGSSGALNDLTDVTITTPSSGQVLKYNGSAWVNDTDATGGGGISDGDKGDITVSASGATWTIDNAAVTLAKMANLAQDQFIGRVTASTGVPETATITAAARTVLDDATVAAMVNTLGGATSTGSGGLVRATSPTLVTPALGTPSSGTLTNCTGLPISGVTNLQTTLDGKLSGDLATEITATKASPIGADQIILLDSADSDTPKLATISSLPGSGTVTSVEMTVPTGLSVSGSPITSSGTLAVTLAGGYVIPTQATLDAKQGLASTVGTSLGTTGTVNLDLAALTGTIQTITLTGDPTFTTSNRAAGRKFELRLAAGGATRTVTWPAGWVAFGAALPTSIASGTVLRVAIECLGTADTNIDVTSVVSA